MTNAPLSAQDRVFLNALEKICSNRVREFQGYMEVPTVALIQRVDVALPELPNISFYLREKDQITVLREAGQPLSPVLLSQKKTVWVKQADFEAIRLLAQNQLINPPAEHALPIVDRMESLRKTAFAVTEDLFSNPSPENIRQSLKVVGSLVYVFMKDPRAYPMLSQLSQHDSYTLQHSVGTAVNSIILARKLGLKDEHELQQIGLAGLLHDIGKIRIDKGIINKPGPLDPEEWEQMMGHAQAGHEIVKDNPDLSDGAKRAILEHHEERNGGGYPRGLKEADIHVYSRIVSTCDIFNALTTDRTYAKAQKPFDAFKFMRDQLQKKVAPDLFKQMVLIYGGDP